MSIWICGICKRTLDKSEDPMSHLEVCKPKRIAELEAENEKLEDRNIELLDKIVWLKAEIRRLNHTVVRSDVTKANQIAECGEDKSPITIHACVFCGWLGNDVHKHIRICPKHPMRELEAENKRLRDAIDYLNPDYYMGISVCECSSEYPIGSCLYCDMEQLKQAREQTNERANNGTR